MNKRVKYLLEQEYLGFNPADLDDGKPKTKQSQNVINNAIYTHHPTTMNELRVACKEVLESGTTDLNCIDVSQMVTMSHLFDQRINEHSNGIPLTEEQQKNLDISNWNVSNCKNFNSTFSGCEFFNGDLSQWDVHNSSQFNGMFNGCISFNGDLSQWDVSSCENFDNMFEGCTNFNQDLSHWNVSAGTSFVSMFEDCTVFNSDISGWLVGGVVDLHYMFAECPNFNQDLSEWDVSLCTTLVAMFRGCTSFNQDLSRWDPRNCKYFSGIFAGCENLNFDITKWRLNPDASGVNEMFNDDDLMAEEYELFLGFRRKY